MSTKKTDIVKVNKQIQKVNTSVVLTAKVFRISNIKYIKLFKKHPKFFIDLISLRYPLTKYDLEKYKDYLNWEKISANSSINWDISLIEKYKDKLSWNGMFCLSQNPALPWSMSFIERYANLWDWKGIWSLSTNPALPWSFELVDKYKDKWSWHRLSWNVKIPVTIDMVQKFEHKWNWKGLSRNETLPKESSILDKYKHKIDTNITPFKMEKAHSDLTIEVIEKYEEKWDWKQLSRDEDVPWTVKLINRYQDKWDWREHGLSRNEALPWSFDLLNKYEKNWNWDRLSLNFNLWKKAFESFVDEKLVKDFFFEFGVN